jgi:hypothetical protein
MPYRRRPEKETWAGRLSAARVDGMNRQSLRGALSEETDHKA